MPNEIVYMAGEVIFRQGYPADHAYVVLTGEVEIYRETADGSEERLAVLPPGQMFGEMGVLDDAPRSASARAVTLARLQIVPL